MYRITRPSPHFRLSGQRTRRSWDLEESGNVVLRRFGLTKPSSVGGVGCGPVRIRLATLTTSARRLQWDHGCQSVQRRFETHPGSENRNSSWWQCLNSEFAIVANVFRWYGRICLVSQASDTDFGMERASAPSSAPLFSEHLSEIHPFLSANVCNPVSSTKILLFTFQEDCMWWL